MLPVTDRVTPAEPVKLPVGWFVVNLNLYTAESLSLRLEILRVHLLFPQRYSTRPEYSGSVLRSTWIPVTFLNEPESFLTCSIMVIKCGWVCVGTVNVHCWSSDGTDLSRSVTHIPVILTLYHCNTENQIHNDTREHLVHFLLPVEKKHNSMSSIP